MYSPRLSLDSLEPFLSKLAVFSPGLLVRQGPTGTQHLQRHALASREYSRHERTRNIRLCDYAGVLIFTNQLTIDGFAFDLRL